jgi:citrate lyase subunit beta / citryl-CoA lyase
MKKHSILLFTPGNRMEFIEKAAKYHPDAIIIDLEDAVPIHLKEQVRPQVAAIIPKLDVNCLVRVNNDPKYLKGDLDAVVSRHLSGIMLPKVETTENIRSVDKMLTGLEKEKKLPPGSVKLLIMIETALGVIRCFDLASASDRIDSVVCSSGEEGDLQTNLECAFSGLEYARAKIMLDSRAAGIRCILDGVFANIKDDEALRRDCLYSKELGYDGRALIHPRHISIAREIYTPTPEKLDYYRRMIQAFEEAESQGIAAISFEGKMVDYAMIKRAKAELSES